MDANTTIPWTYEKLKRFKKVYAIVKEQGKESFLFENHEFLVSYAKYLIEYLESRFKTV